MTAYEQGFLTKCAEYGIDGSELLKQAKEQTNYAGPLGGIAATGGGLLGAMLATEGGQRTIGGATVENAAEYAAALKHLGKDIGLYFRHGLSPSYLKPEQINTIRKGTGDLLSNPGWMRQAAKDVRLSNIGDWLVAGGKVGMGAAALGIPAYGIAKIVQNAARRNKE